jgi:hypothetical protein
MGYSGLAHSNQSGQICHAELVPGEKIQDLQAGPVREYLIKVPQPFYGSGIWKFTSGLFYLFVIYHFA